MILFLSLGNPFPSINIIAIDIIDFGVKYKGKFLPWKGGVSYRVFSKRHVRSSVIVNKSLSLKSKKLIGITLFSLGLLSESKIYCLKIILVWFVKMKENVWLNAPQGVKIVYSVILSKRNFPKFIYTFTQLIFS